MDGCEICLFCYKTCERDKLTGEGQTHAGNANGKVNRFVSILERFTGSQRYQELSDDFVHGLKLLGRCKSCGVLVDAFCDEYHKLKCLEMKLEWKLDRLAGIMELAGRIPSRWLNLQEILERGNLSTSPISSGNMKESLKSISSYRQKILKGCNNRLTSSQPRVSLKRIEIDHKFIGRISKPVRILSSTETGTTSPSSEDKIIDHNKIKLEVETFENLAQEMESVDMDTASGNVQVEPTTVIVRVKIPNIEETQNSLSDMNNFSDHEDTCDNEWDSSSDTSSSATSTEIQAIIKTEPNENNQNSSKSPVNPEAQNFPCQQCSKTFSSKQSIGAHLRAVHVLAKYQCPTCKQMFKTSYNLHRHCILNKHRTPKASNIFQCSKCSESCGTQWLLERHYVRVHGIHSCKECSQEFKTKRLRHKHLIEIHKYPTSLHECDQCDRKFPYKYKLSKHKLSVHKLGAPIPCTDCPKTFKHSHSLINHQKSQSISLKSSEIICKFCYAKFPSRNHLGSHVRQEHVNKGNVGNCKLIQCSKCESKFLNNNRYNLHIRQVHTTAKHQCLKCLRRFKLKDSLVRHQVIHEEKKIQCNECGQMFFTQNALKFHTKSHHSHGSKNIKSSASHANNTGNPNEEKEGKHKCPECGKIFGTNAHLRDHLLTHQTGERLDCKHCDRTFKHSRALQRHCRAQHGIYAEKLQAHGEHECKKCGKMWLTVTKLKRHLVTHQKGEPLICKYCGGKYPHIFALKKHVSRMHKNLQNSTSTSNNGD